MVNTAAIEAKRQGMRRALDAVYEVLTVNVPTATSDGELSDLAKVPKQDVANLRVDLTTTGALQHYRARDGKLTRSKWMLVDTKDVAGNKLKRRWEKLDRQTAERLQAMGEDNRQRFTGRRREGGRGANGVGARLLPRGLEPSHVSSTNGATPDHPVVPPVLVASSGPQAPTQLAAGLTGERKDEPLALVEAARRYGSLYAEVDDKIRELEKLGVKVDREKIAKSMTLPQDSRLAAVALVVPYIDNLERQNERLRGQIAHQTEKLAGLPDLQRNHDRLKESNVRLLAEKNDLLNRLNERVQERQPAPKDVAPSATG